MEFWCMNTFGMLVYITKMLTVEERRGFSNESMHCKT